MKKLIKQLLQIRSIQNIETNNKTMRSKPHIKIVVSKRLLTVIRSFNCGI